MNVDVDDIPWKNLRSADLGSWVRHHSLDPAASRVEHGVRCFGSFLLVVVHWFSHCAVSIHLRELCCPLAFALIPLVLNVDVVPSS